MLAKANLELKDKLSTVENEHSALLKKVRSAAPWIEKLLEEVESKVRGE